MAEKDYLLDSDQEPLRLERQAELYGVENDLRRLAPSAQDSVLDAGCGSGAISRAIAKTALRVTGVDRAQAYVDFARRKAAVERVRNASFVTGDLLILPFRDQTFDLVWSKHVLQWVREPQRAIAEFRRVVRSGGRIMCCNFDGFALYHYPVEPELQKDVEHGFLEAAQARLGFDALIGRKLYAMFHRAGLVDIRVDFEPDRVFGVAGPLGEARRQNWEVQAAAAMAFTADVFGSRKRAEEFWQRFIAYLDRADTYSFCALFYVQGTVP